MENFKELDLKELEDVAGGTGENWTEAERDHYTDLLNEIQRVNALYAEDKISQEEATRAWTAAREFYSEMCDKYGR